jgi:POT family proton-dependent oligopeptide transporter
MSTSSARSTGHFPSQARFILGNEAAERYSYYGIKGILALYITGVLLKDEDYATNVIHMFGFVNYFMPLLGAWVSDRFWGRYRTILWISLVYCCGNGVLAFSDAFHSTDAKVWCLFAGLGLIAFGSGGIKPCVSAFMGDQFKPEERHLLPKAYAAFYWCINLGSTAAFLTIPFIRKHCGYGWAFGIPGVAMACATFVFWLGTKRYTMVPPASKTKSAGFFKVLFYAFEHRHEKTAGQHFWDAARAKYSNAEVDAAKSVLPILGVFALVPVFWALFDQTFSTWVMQGKHMRAYEIAFDVPLTWLRPIFASVPEVFHAHYNIGPEEMLSANPILVMILIPVMTGLVYPLAGRLATPLRRMCTGMFLAAFSFVIVAWLQHRLDHGAQLSILWQVAPYLVITVAEVLFSTTGLEFAFREAAPSMKSIIMGFWSLTVAIGNLLVTFITSIAGKVLGSGNGHAVSVTPTMFLFYAGLTFVVAIGFTTICGFYRYHDSEAAHGR